MNPFSELLNADCISEILLRCDPLSLLLLGETCSAFQAVVRPLQRLQRLRLAPSPTTFDRATDTTKLTPALLALAIEVKQHTISLTLVVRMGAARGDGDGDGRRGRKEEEDEKEKDEEEEGEEKKGREDERASRRDLTPPAKRRLADRVAGNRWPHQPAEAPQPQPHRHLSSPVPLAQLLQLLQGRGGLAL